MFLKNKWMLTTLMLSLVLVLAACGSNGNEQENANEEQEEQQTEGSDNEQEEQTSNIEEPITFADAGWQSIRFHNWVARTIVENGYGYETKQIPGGEASSFKGLKTGDIDVYLEIWTGNITKKYQEALDNNDIAELGVNYADNKQGFYVPTYVIEGDSERGIEPMAPDLQSVEDLKDYPELFEDPADPGMGRVVGSIPGWFADTVMKKKMEHYGLNENFNYFQPGSGAALAASIEKAFQEKAPWVGYYWEPTWITGKYDLTLLEEPEYNEEDWNDGYKTAFPSQRLTVAVPPDFVENAPQITDFLKNYNTSSDLTSEGLAYMQDNDASAEEAAHWWMNQHQDLWTEWVSDDVAQKVKEAIQE